MSSVVSQTRIERIPPGLPVVIQFFVFLTTIGWWAIHTESPADYAGTIFALSLFFSVQYVWSVASWYAMTGKLFDFYQIFLLAVAMFHGGQAFLEVFDLNKEGFLEDKFTHEVALQTLFVVDICFAALHLGALIAVSRNRRAVRLASPVVERAENVDANLRLVGWGLLAISIPFTLLGFRTLVGVVLSGGYMALYQQDASNGFGAIPKVLSAFLIPGTMFLLAGSGTKPRSAYFAAALVVVFATMQFFIGERHNGALAMVSLAWIWHRAVRPLNPALLIGGALLLVGVVFPFVRANRESSGTSRTSVSEMVESFVSIENPAVSAIHEMGGSVYTLSYTMTLVPSERPYDCGESYFFAVLTLFPNLIWDVHPSIAKGIPGDWLAWIVDPYSAARGAGFGYSLFGEAYLNFGTLGGALFMVLFGWGYAAFVLWADQPCQPARWAFAASMAFFFLFIARSEFAIVVRGIVWYALVPYLTAVVFIPKWNAWKSQAGRIAGVAT